jgi:hypothetical protein
MPPWERYQTAEPASSGPWAKYAAPVHEQTADEAMASPEGQQLAKELRSKADRQILEEAGAGPVSTALSGFANAAFLNAPRNVAAGIRSVRDGKSFSDEYAFLKSVDEAAARERGATQAAGISGALAGGALIPIAPAASLFGRAAQGAALGGGLSGASELIDTKDLGSAARAGVTGAAFGAPLGVAGGAIADRFAAPSAGKANEIIVAADRLGVNVPRAVATDSMAIQRLGNVAKNVPFAGDPLVKSSERAISDLQGAAARTAEGYGVGGVSGPNVANRIGGTVRGLADEEAAANRAIAERETQALRDAATAQDEMATGVGSGALERQREQALGRVDAVEGRARQLAAGEFGNLSPQELGQTVTARLRTAEQDAKGLKDELYGVAAKTDANINAGAVREVHGRVAQSLEDAGRIIDPVLTPAAARMMDRLSGLSQLKVPNKAVGTRLPSDGAEIFTEGMSFQAIEQTRKVLNGLSRAATNDADRSSAKMIIGKFDDWLSDSFDKALYSGSDEALSAIKSARAANTEWRQNFGFNSKTDADRIINKIATGEVTPQETANWIIGATKVGASGSSARLMERIARATNNDPEVAQAIRSGIWNRLSQNAEGVERGNPEQVANGIFEFLNGSGQPVSRSLFDTRQRRIMEIYAETIRTASQQRTAIEKGAKAVRTETTKVADVRPEIGPMEELANTVLGRGGKTDEALFSTIEAYSKSGSRGDLKTLGKLLTVIPEEARGDLAAALIGKMGVSPRAANQFSGDVWLSNWRTMTPQAKAMIFGMTGNLRQSLDDIATVSQRFKEMNKFANPSGTAQNVAGAGVITALIAEPVTTISSIVGGNVAARILAAPATASSMSKWSMAYDLAVRKPSAVTASGLTIASRNLSGTIAKTLGVQVDPAALLRGVSNQRPSRADNENTDQIPAIRRQ